MRFGGQRTLECSSVFFYFSGSEVLVVRFMRLSLGARTEGPHVKPYPAFCFSLVLAIHFITTMNYF